MPSIVVYWIVYGVINNCESIGTTFEIVTFVVNLFRRHIMMTLAICIYYNVIYTSITVFNEILLGYRVMNDRNVQLSLCIAEYIY